MPHRGLGLFIVNVAPVDTEGRAGGSIEVALKVKERPRKGCTQLAGLITIGPLMREQLGRLCRIPA